MEAGWCGLGRSRGGGEGGGDVHVWTRVFLCKDAFVFHGLVDGDEMASDVCIRYELSTSRYLD